MSVRSKRNTAANFAAKSGVVSVLEHVRQQDCLLVLTYHRIGDRAAAPYDPGVYSATPDELDRQISYLKKQFLVVGVEEALDFVEKTTRRKRASLLITFDDGYRDNYQIAFKVLASHSVTGLFFLPTEHIENGAVPWWDSIAYAIKHTKKDKIRLECTPAEFVLAKGRLSILEDVLAIFKSPLNQDPDRFLQDLAAACEIELPTVDKTLFLNWSEASEMIKGGMAIGSHTHTHRILAKLTPEQQLEELTVSRTILEEKLNTRVQSVSYPVGGADCFSDATIRCTQTAGYKLGFSFYGGINLPGRTNKFDIRRLGVGADQTFSRFRTNVNLCAVAGRDWSF